MLIVAFGVGLPLALIAAERGRRTERVIGPLTEVVMALPGNGAAAGRDRDHRQQPLHRHGRHGSPDLGGRLSGDARCCPIGATAAVCGRRPGQRPGIPASESGARAAVDGDGGRGAGRAAVRHRPGDRRRPRLPRLRSGGAGTELGLHDPGRFRAPLRRPVADGANRPGAGAHRDRCQRAGRRDRRQGGRGRSGASAAEASGSRAAFRSASRRGGRDCTRRPERCTGRWSGLSIAVNDGPALVTDVSFSLHPGQGARAWSASRAAARR